MNCESVNSTLGAFADGELSASDAGQIRAHIDSCGSCKADLEEILAVRSALHHWPAQKPSSGLDYRVMESFRAEHHLRPRPSVFRFGAFLAGSVRMPKIAVPAALAVALVAVAIAYTVGQSAGSTPPLASPALSVPPLPGMVEVPIEHERFVYVRAPRSGNPTTSYTRRAATQSPIAGIGPVTTSDRIDSLQNFEPVKGATARVIEGSR